LCGGLQDKILSFLAGYHGKCNKIALFCKMYTSPSYNILMFVTTLSDFILVTPLPIVVIAAASRYQHYGVHDEQGNLLL